MFSAILVNKQATVAGPERLQETYRRPMCLLVGGMEWEETMGGVLEGTVLLKFRAVSAGNRPCWVEWDQGDQLEGNHSCTGQ